MDSGVQRTRGFYRTKARTPRQTVYNRRKKLVKGKSIEPSPLTNCTPRNAQSSANETIDYPIQDTNEDITDFINNDTEQPMIDYGEISTTSSAVDASAVASEDIDHFSNNDMDQPMADYGETSTLSSHSAVDNESKAEESTASPRLYEGSMLTTENSLLLLNSYMCHHNLTQQGCQDLLQLLRLHLPTENALPSSLYLFHKQSKETESQNTDVEPNYHHYCPECYTLLSDREITLCVNEYCEADVNFDLSPCFMTVSIADQLKNFFASESPHDACQLAMQCIHTSTCCLNCIII